MSAQVKWTLKMTKCDKWISKTSIEILDVLEKLKEHQDESIEIQELM